MSRERQVRDLLARVAREHHPAALASISRNRRPSVVRLRDDCKSPQEFNTDDCQHG